MADTARLRLRISSSLKARMDRFGGGYKASWSAIASIAFEAELARLEALEKAGAIVPAVPASAPTPIVTESPEVAAAVRNLADAAAHLARVLNPDVP